MCGIVGFIDFKCAAGETELKGMADCLQYRGPDSAGYEMFPTPSYNIGLGHRRLSIIDLSPLGHQPMYSGTKEQVVVFNGEIYNYNEIKAELVQKGHVFVSNSDTEVILAAYREWGEQAVSRFIGMFAIVIYDRGANRLFLCRDRAGVKPLYYYWDGNTFLFASELKSFFGFPGFKKNIDNKAVKLFLEYSFVPAPYSIFENTSKLSPGHSMTIDLSSGKISSKLYWNVLDYYKADKLIISEQEALPELEQQLRKACEYRMVSDVPVGVFLSGGYDSSLVTALLQTGRSQKIKTFTIGFNESGYNEAGHAKKVAEHLGTDHHELYCSFSDARAIIPELPVYYDEPFGDSSAIPTILVSRFARQTVTVALSADGGDELFAGYGRYNALMNIAGKVKKIPAAARKPLGWLLEHAPGPVRKKLAPGKNTSAGNITKYAKFIKGELDIVDMIDLANQTAMTGYIDAFLSAGGGAFPALFKKQEIREIESDLSKLLAFDYLSYLPNDILTKVDRATMSASLEGREPLLDHKVMEWTARLPDHLKQNNLQSKYILRKLVHKYIPSEIMERPKMGFSVPLVDWFRGELKHVFEEHLNEEALSEHGLFNHDVLKKEMELYYQGDDFRFPLLWNFLMFQLWYEKWMK